MAGQQTTYVERSRIPILAIVGACFSGLLLMALTATPLTAQTTIEEHQDLEDAVNGLRRLYQDVYPRFQDIKMFRQGGQSNRAEEVVSELQSEIENRLQTIKQHLDSVNSNKRTVQKRVQNVRRMMDVFVRYQKKVLSNWEPKNPQLLKAFNDRELMQRGMASPEILRRKFITDLTGALLTEGYVSENIPAKNLNSYADQVQSMYRDVLNTFLSMLNRIESARNNDEKDIQEVIEAVDEEWTSYWERFGEKRDTLQNKINRTLILYRDQKHLTSYQKLRYEKGVRLKREVNEIMAFQKSVKVDNLFANQQAVYKLLVLMGKKYGNRLIALLNENTSSHNAMFRKFMQNSQRLQTISSESEYSKLRSSTDDWLDGVFGEFDLESAVQRIRSVPVQQLSSLVRRLRSNYGEKEKRLGTAINNLRQYAIDFFEFSKTARRIPRDFVERFKEVSFESQEQFSKDFPGPLTKKINELNQRQQNITRRLDEIEKQFKNVVEKHFPSQKTDENTSEQ